MYRKTPVGGGWFSVGGGRKGVSPSSFLSLEHISNSILHTDYSAPYEHQLYPGSPGLDFSLKSLLLSIFKVLFYKVYTPPPPMQCNARNLKIIPSGIIHFVSQSQEINLFIFCSWFLLFHLPPPSLPRSLLLSKVGGA